MMPQSKQQQQQHSNRLMYHSNHHLHFYNNTNTPQYKLEISYFEKPQQLHVQSKINGTIQRNYSIQHKVKPKYIFNNNLNASTDDSSFDSTLSAFPTSSDEEGLRSKRNKKVLFKKNSTGVALKTTQIINNSQKARSTHATPDSAYATLTNSSNNLITHFGKQKNSSQHSYELPLTDSSINDVSSNFSLEKPSTYYFETINNKKQLQPHQSIKYQQQPAKKQQFYHESSLILQRCESEILFDDSTTNMHIDDDNLRCKTPLPSSRNDDSYKVSNELMQNSLLNSTLNTYDFDNMDTSELGDYIDKLRIQFRLNSNLYTNYENMSFLKEKKPSPNSFHLTSPLSHANKSNSTLNSTVSPYNNNSQLNHKKNIITSRQTFETGTSSNITTVTKEEVFIHNNQKMANKSEQISNVCSSDNDEIEESNSNNVNNIENNATTANDNDFNDATFINFTQSYELIDTYMDYNEIKNENNFDQPSGNDHQQFMQESEIVEEEEDDGGNSNKNDDRLVSKPPTPILVQQYQQQKLPKQPHPPLLPRQQPNRRYFDC